MTTRVSEDVWRREAPHVLTALMRRSSSFEDCEDATQEALLAAAEQWPRDGVPNNPRSWLIRVASRKLIDQNRSRTAELARAERLARQDRLDSPEAGVAVSGQDDIVALLLLCAHRALTDASAVALTLRAVAGLSTTQIAYLLLTTNSTVGQRISRAKATIRDQGLHLHRPRADDLPDRLHAARHVIYLTFTAGHTTYEGDQILDTSLVREAIWMAEQLHAATVFDDETAGLLALMLLTDARSAARVNDAGNLVPLAEQDRTRWDQTLIRRGVTIVEQILPRGHVGPFQLQAAIAAVHAEAPSADQTDWPQIAILYRMLQRVAPSPTVDLNLAVAVGMAFGPDAGIDSLTTLLADPTQRKNHRVHAAHAHLLAQAGRCDEARTAFERAAQLTASIPEQRYLNAKAAGLGA